MRPPTAWGTRAAQRAQYEQFAQQVEQMSPGQVAAMFGQAPVPPIFEHLPGYGVPTPAHELLPSVFRGAGAPRITTTLYATANRIWCHNVPNGCIIP